MNTVLRREGDKVWLEGVSTWFVGEKESSVHAAQAAAMEAAGYDIPYDYLVGVSGLAFRMQVSKAGLCPSSPHPFCGYHCVGRSVRALPLQPHIFEVKPDHVDEVAEARQAVVDSIERGMPVQYGDEEDGLIFGYQKGGREWLAYHPMKDGGKKPFIETGWPWGIAIFGPEEREVPDTAGLARGALEQAVGMSHTAESGGYHLGFAAWGAYIARLEYLLGVDAERRAGDQMGNAWIYECLAGFRSCAARYLRTVAPRFKGDVPTCLMRAAGLYDRMATEILRDEDHRVVDIAPYAWSQREGQTWSSEAIRGQIQRLEVALPVEREAIGELESALDLVQADAEGGDRLGGAQGEPGAPEVLVGKMTDVPEYVTDVSGWESWKQDYRFGVLLIVPPDPPLSAVNALRARYAWSQGAECDAHISLSVPLPRAVNQSDWAELQAIAAAIEPFSIHYGPLMNYLPAAPGVCLRIEPQAELAGLLAALEAARCFCGARARPYPFSAHMTIAELISVERTVTLMDELNAEAPQGTFTCTHVSYSVPDAGFRFTERGRLRLGSRSGP